ncbi:MAG: hypothetical protein P8X63_00440 [Desulfuromonadaceae bacterium]
MQNGETANLMGLLIADEDLESRKRMAALFIEAGYQITVTNSAAYAMYGILKNVTQVVLLSHHFDEQPAVNLIPLLKQCNNDLTIILVGDEKSSLSTQKTRHEGVFYHALRPTAIILTIGGIRNMVDNLSKQVREYFSIRAPLTLT